MRGALLGIVLLIILVGGTVMGIASLLLLPLVGAVLLVALLIWFVQRRAAGKPPIR
jgi:hypothetical protein